MLSKNNNINHDEIIEVSVVICYHSILLAEHKVQPSYALSLWAILVDGGGFLSACP
jgi:hypothetical protein